MTGEYPSATGYGTVAVAASLLGDKYGLDWITVVAVPRSDFMSRVTSSLYNSLMIASICVVLALLVGLTTLNRILRDIRKLTNAAKRIGNGDPVSQLKNQPRRRNWTARPDLQRDGTQPADRQADGGIQPRIAAGPDPLPEASGQSGPAGKSPSLRCCSSTWTSSRASTTVTVMTPAINS
ncbi:hypothetical protein ACFS07_14165 [Undibacterium arcticum]